MNLIDLSHPLEHGQKNFPFDPKPSVLVFNTVETIGYNMTEISMATHQGTHLDAPYHFYMEGKTVDQMELEQFIGEACLIDLAPGGSLAAGEEITIESFLPHEEKFLPGAKIIYRTGWDHMFNTHEFFTGFPTLTLDTAKWIADKQIGLIGMDTPTPSYDWKEVHLTLLAPGVEMVIVEALTNLDQLPERFMFMGFPLNIKGRDGSPIRAVAQID